MRNDSRSGCESETCEICSGYEGDGERHCSEGSNKGDAAAAGKVIDLKERASQLRVKGMVSGAVSSLQATKALALGLMYLHGEGAGRDASRAAKLLTTAVQGSVPQAKHELARLHIEGEGVPYDPAYGIKLLQSASDDEYVPSMVYLAELYIFGQHCATDADAALELLYSAYSIAADQEPAVMYYLGYVYDRAPDCRNTFEAAYWYRRAAEHGHFKSQIRLAALYATGTGVPHCVETSVAFLEVAMETARQQDPRFLLWQGERFIAQPETEFLAQALIKTAAEMHHTPAQRMMLQQGWARA